MYRLLAKLYRVGLNPTEFTAPNRRTLSEFFHYDGYFDTAALDDLPLFNQIPYIDWYIWWFGLDPKLVDHILKRNNICIQQSSWNKVKKILLNSTCQFNNKIKLLFAPIASTLLRTIPTNIRRYIVESIVNLDNNILVYTQVDTGVKHERVINLEKEIKNINEFASLIVQCDFCISADSFASHVCDAASIPCVTLSSSIPHYFFPYYPYGTVLEIDDLPNLPFYKRSFVDDQEFEKKKKLYDNAWSKINVAEILNNLYTFRSKNNAYDFHGVHISATSPEKIKEHNLIINSGRDMRLARLRVPPYFLESIEIISSLIPKILPDGGTCILVNVGTSELAVKIGRHISDFDGKLIIFEPRKIFKQICECALVCEGYTNALVLEQVPIVDFKKVKLPKLDPWCESNVEKWGNIDFESIYVDTLAIDKLNLEICHVVILQPPLFISNTLKGCMSTIERCQPTIIASPVTISDIEKFSIICSYNYEMQIINISSNYKCLIFIHKDKIHLFSNNIFKSSSM